MCLYRSANIVYEANHGLCNFHGPLKFPIVAGTVVRLEVLSHEMTLSYEGCRPKCDNVSRVSCNN